MKDTETVKLVLGIRKIWPSMKIDDFTPDAWHPILADIDFADAESAVYALARSHPGYIAPVDIRRQVAADAGLLPPADAEAFVAVLAVAAAEGVGASKLHPAVQAAYRAMGGPTAFDAPPAILRPQWGRAYQAACAAHERELLAGDLGVAINAHQRAALTAAEDRPAIEAPPEDPTVRDRSAEVAALVQTTRFSLPPADRSKLHPRRVGWEREHRAWERTRTAEPNPHFVEGAKLDQCLDGAAVEPEAS